MARLPAAIRAVQPPVSCLNSSTHCNHPNGNWISGYGDGAFPSPPKAPLLTYPWTSLLCMGRRCRQNCCQAMRGAEETQHISCTEYSCTQRCRSDMFLSGRFVSVLHYLLWACRTNQKDLMFLWSLLPFLDLVVLQTSAPRYVHIQSQLHQQVKLPDVQCNTDSKAEIQILFSDDLHLQSIPHSGWRRWLEPHPQPPTYFHIGLTRLQTASCSVCYDGFKIPVSYRKEKKKALRKNIDRQLSVLSQ